MIQLAAWYFRRHNTTAHGPLCSDSALDDAGHLVISHLTCKLNSAEATHCPMMSLGEATEAAGDRRNNLEIRLLASRKNYWLVSYILQ